MENAGTPDPFPQADAKEGVVDIVCEDKNHSQYIIELENNTPTTADAVNRLLYYSASVMITTVEAGQGYDNLKEIYGMMVTKKDVSVKAHLSIASKSALSLVMIKSCCLNIQISARRCV